MRPVRAVVANADLNAHIEPLEDWAWAPVPGTDKSACRLDPKLEARLKRLKVSYKTEAAEDGGAGSEYVEQVEAVARWYLKDWTKLDAKIRTTIVEGISVFLSLFDQPDVAGCSVRPRPMPRPAGTSKPMVTPRRSTRCRGYAGGCRPSPT